LPKGRGSLNVRFAPIVLQNYFAPQSEENFSKSSPNRGILVQETGHLDSDIAHL
jgi:hypothetical protein